MPSFKYLIQPDGNVVVQDICGFGKDCTSKMDHIEKILGKVNESTREYTDEYGEQVDDIDIAQDTD